MVQLRTTVDLGMYWTTGEFRQPHLCEMVGRSDGECQGVTSIVVLNNLQGSRMRADAPPWKK